MNIFRNWLVSSVEELHAEGGLWAVCLYLLLGTCLLPVITGFLLVALIALMYLALGLSLLRGLVLMHAKLFTRNKTRSSNVKM
jgi:hypothetical protein